MFIFKKLLTPFMLPPGLFVLVLSFIGTWGLRRRNNRVAAAVWATAVLIWILSIQPTADLMMRRLEAGLSIPSDFRADVIVLLGGGLLEKSADLSGQGSPGPGTMERMVTAARLYRRLSLPIVVSGGRVYPGGTSIAEVTRRFLVDLGIPPKAVILEDRSRDTHENAVYCRAVCEQWGFTRPLLVTSGYHLRRALLCFEKAGLPADAMPCALTTYPDKSYKWHHFLPTAGALRTVSEAAHEFIGLIYARLFY